MCATPGASKGPEKPPLVVFSMCFWGDSRSRDPDFEWAKKTLMTGDGTKCGAPRREIRWLSQEFRPFSGEMPARTRVFHCFLMDFSGFLLDFRGEQLAKKPDSYRQMRVALWVLE